MIASENMSTSTTIAAGLLGLTAGVLLGAHMFGRTAEPPAAVEDPILCVVQDDSVEVRIASTGFTQKCMAFFEEQLLIQNTPTGGVISGRRFVPCEGYQPFGPLKLSPWETRAWLDAAVGYILQDRQSDAVPYCFSAHGGGHLNVQWKCDKRPGGAYELNSAACGNALTSGQLYDRADAVTRLDGLVSALGAMAARTAPVGPAEAQRPSVPPRVQHDEGK